MADLNESSHFLLQPLNFNTATPPPPGKTDYHVYQSDTSEGRNDKATPAMSGNSGYDEATRSWYDERDAEQRTEDTGLLIREIKKDDNDNLPKKQTRNIFLVWGYELALLLLATGLLGAMFAILGAYNTHEMPNWNDVTGVGITLNALIAVIATIFRAILAFVALEVLAQLKWDWITKAFRPMGDMQRYDDASRGAWGSLMLLPIVFKRQPQAIIAVIVVVVSLATGPMTQQTIQPYYCPQKAPEQKATITVAYRLDNISIYYSERPSAYKFHVGLEAAIQDAVVNPSQSSNIDGLFDCPSGNCTFQAYPDNPGQPDQQRVSHASLGMCSRCEDISKMVRIKMSGPLYGRAQARLNLTVSTGLNETKDIYIISGDPSQGARYLDSTVAANLSWAREALPKDFLNLARWSAANWTMLAFSQQNCKNGNQSCPLQSPKYKFPAAWEEPTGYFAAACAFYPCVKHYSGIVRTGALSETVVKSTPLRVQVAAALPDANADSAAVGNNDLWRGVQSPCFVNDTLYTSSNMTSASEKLPQGSRDVVSIFPKDWEEHDLDKPIGYTNVTAPNECIMTLTPNFINAFRRNLAENFNAYCRLVGFQTDFLTCFTFGEKTSLPMVSILRKRTTSIKTLRENIDSMAMRITTEMRRAGFDAYGMTKATAKGNDWENKSCLKVAWEWLILPVILLLMCIVSMCWLIIRELLSKGNGVVWKSSILPFLLKDKVPALEKMSLKELDLTSKKLEIKLEK